MNVTLTGYLRITPNWAQLNLDPNQQLQGYVVLMKDPMKAQATDGDFMDAARGYFIHHDGDHYSFIGELTNSGNQNYLLMTNFVQQ